MLGDVAVIVGSPTLKLNSVQPGKAGLYSFIIEEKMKVKRVKLYPDSHFSLDVAHKILYINLVSARIWHSDKSESEILITFIELN